MVDTHICFLTATQLAQHIRNQELSVSEVMTAHLAQIERIDPKVNAIPTLLPEKAMAQAKAADEALAKGETAGPLFGLPIAHKDLALTKGIRTTFGSPLFKNFVPLQDTLIVERLKKGGAITIGKTNVPEFGAGSQTYNEIFGETLNPYDLTKTCGGSSGGAAVALACGMIPLADGSDMGGSLRNPASYCNVVGFRPSAGRVPIWPKEMGWGTLGVHGPMARTVEDVALMLSVIAGPDARSPISLTEPGAIFTHSLQRDFKNVRIAWSQDLGGLPVDPQVTAAIEPHRATFEALGCPVEEAEPDFAGADESFKAYRAWSFATTYAELLKTNRDKIKDTVIWNIEAGLDLTALELGQAEKQRTALYQSTREFMNTYEFLIAPVSQVPPFDIDQRYITEINGQPMETYIDWMRSAYYITATGHPAISVPCGFTEDGLPIGMQIVGRHQADFAVLQLAYAFQQATEVWRQRPALVK